MTESSKVFYAKCFRGRRDYKVKSRLFDSEFVKQSAIIREIGSAAVKKAQEENRRLGIPNAYFINGKTYYELPDGTLSLEDPWEE